MMSGRNYQTIKFQQVKYKCTKFPKNIYNGGNTFLVTVGSGIHMVVIN